MLLYTYDTSTVIARRVTALPRNLLLSTVVLAELMSAAPDEATRKYYEAVYRQYRADGTLIVPDEDDWLLTGKVLYWLTQGRRRQAGGKLPRLVAGASQRMALDVLLAVSARRWGATVVTENWDDFQAVRRYCDVKVVRGRDFFK